MSATDFTKKGLNQKIFSKKAVRATVGRLSPAFRGLMENKTAKKVIDKRAEKRVFYNALKKRGSESKRGITRNVLKKVMGDIEHSGEFSHHEMIELRKNLVGGPMSSNIIREHESKKEDVPRETGRSMQEIYKEIMDKNKTSQSDSSAGVQKNNNIVSAPSNVLDFGVSKKNLRKAEKLFVQSDNTQKIHKHSTLAEYIAEHGDGDMNDVRSMLARIQGNAEENKETDLTQEYPEVSSQKITEQIKDNVSDSQSEKEKLIVEISAKAIAQEKPLRDEEEPVKKDNPIKINENNISQIIKIGQEKIQVMSLAGQEDSPDYKKLFSLLMKNQDGTNVWKSAEEVDIASIEADIESIIEKNSKEEEKLTIELDSKNEPKSLDMKQIQIEDEKTDLAA